MTTTTIHSVVDDAVTNCIRPQWHKVVRATLDGNAVIAIYKPDDTVARIAKILEPHRGSVQPLTRTRAARVFANAEPAILEWLTARKPSGQARIFLVTNALFILLNHTKDRGFWDEPGTWLGGAKPPPS